MVKAKGIFCTRIFKEESLKRAVCPFCGAMGNKLVICDEGAEDD